MNARFQTTQTTSAQEEGFEHPVASAAGINERAAFLAGPDASLEESYRKEIAADAAFEAFNNLSMLVAG